MRITVELTDKQCAVLRSYASVGRFLDAVDVYLETAIEGHVITKDEAEDGTYLRKDTEILKSPLMEFHSQARQQLVQAGVKPLWDQNQRS